MIIKMTLLNLIYPPKTLLKKLLANMKMKLLNKILVFFLLSPFLVFSQNESDDVRAGNRFYKDKKYTEAEIEYRKALQKNNKSFQANYNLGNSLFRQGKYDQAFEQYKAAAPLTDQNKEKLAANFHNIGNVFMSGGKFQEAISAYKTALKNNPKDNETRYNLAYAQSLLQKQEQSQDNQNNQNDQNKDQDKQNEPNDESKEQPENKQPEQQQPQMSKENAQQILNALEQDEKDTQEKAKKAQGRSSRRVEKDW